MINPSLIKTTIDIINQFGSPITLGTDAISEYNTDTGRIEEVTPPNSRIVKSVIENYTSQEVGGLINAGDIKMIISNEIIPTMNTRVTFNNLDYNIINIEPTFLEGAVVMFEIQVRK